MQRVGARIIVSEGCPHALIYPLTREQIIGAAASVESMRAGDIEPISVIRNPLDVLAQQTVAAASMEDLEAGRLVCDGMQVGHPSADLDRGRSTRVMA